MLTKHTVRWIDTTDESRDVRTTVYFSPTHHDYRKVAVERNETDAKNRVDYDDACGMGRAIIVEHVRETDGEA
jgi:hypothetical protein